MDLWFDTFECRMSFPKWIGNHSRDLHWWISSVTAPMTWSSKVPQRCPITHVAHASVQAAMFVTWNIKNVFAQKAWTVLNAPNVPNFIIVILEDARNVQDMVLRQVPVGDEEYVKMMRWTRWTRCTRCTRWVPSATLATLDISDPLVIALLLAFVDVFHHLLVLDARNPDVKRILKTPSFDLKKDVFKILSEFCGDFDFAKHLKFFVFAKAKGDSNSFRVLPCFFEEGQCPSGEFLHTDADISLRSRWYPQWQACMPCTPGTQNFTLNWTFMMFMDVLLFFKHFRMFCVRLVSCCFHVMLKKSDFTGHVHAAGRFKEDNGNGPCSDCEAGRHQSELGQTACYLCSPGQCCVICFFCHIFETAGFADTTGKKRKVSLEKACSLDDHQPQQQQHDMHGWPPTTKVARWYA